MLTGNYLLVVCSNSSRGLCHCGYVLLLGLCCKHKGCKRLVGQIRALISLIVNVNSTNTKKSSPIRIQLSIRVNKQTNKHRDEETLLGTWVIYRFNLLTLIAVRDEQVWNESSCPFVLGWSDSYPSPGYGLIFFKLKPFFFLLHHLQAC